MLVQLGTLLLLLASPFWEDRAPRDWTDQELITMLTDSPWSHTVPGPGASLPAIQVSLATAKPVQLAEAEQLRRAQAKTPAKEPEIDPFAEEYSTWLAENSKDQIVLAVRVGNHRAYDDEKELQRLEKESVMRAGRKKLPMTGYFPPSAQDPFLRIAFPRKVEPGDKEVRFELYLPGVAGPFRTVEFALDQLRFAGQPEL